MGYPGGVQLCGSFVVDQTHGHRRSRDTRTIAEQITYECTIRLRTYCRCCLRLTDVQLEDLGSDRVRVTGARQWPSCKPPIQVASLTYHDGFRCTATLMIVGVDAVMKAMLVATAILGARRVC